MYSLILHIHIFFAPQQLLQMIGNLWKLFTVIVCVMTTFQLMLKNNSQKINACCVFFNDFVRQKFQY